MAERNLVEPENKLGAVELKLVEVASLNLAQADKIVDLKVALEAFETKWYNEGFADVENSVEPIVHQARSHGFEEGWLADFQAMGVPEDSPLRNLAQIPYPAPPPPVQSQVGVADEEDTPSMRELVRAIDNHAKNVDLKVTSNLNTADDAQGQLPPTGDAPGHHQGIRPMIQPNSCPPNLRLILAFWFSFISDACLLFPFTYLVCLSHWVMVTEHLFNFCLYTLFDLGKVTKH